MENKLPVDPAFRLALIHEVLQKAYEESESWFVDNLGSHLAYLALAIADCKPDSFIEWSEGADGCPTWLVRRQFTRWFPDTHPVWDFIRPIP